jgi:hypothetical protein
MTEIVPTPNLPDLPPAAGEAEWKQLFQKLFLHKLNHIIEIGGVIRRFHDEVNRNPSRWGTNWIALCRDVIGIDHSTASHYEIIWRVFGGNLADSIKIALPARMYTLYLIARAVETNRPKVEAAITSGTINTHMSQKDAKHLLDEILMIEEEHEDVREVKEVKEPLKVKGYLDHQIRKTVEIDIALMAGLYGEDFGRLLRMRRDHPDLFGVVQRWDTLYEARDVTVLLKMLLHEDEP